MFRKHNQNSKKINTVRIIGGQWRGRKITFPDLPGLRPTPDRVRETVFNWLAPHLLGAHCLDMFAGSGVLGFEALSRGARQVVMIDHASIIIQQLRSHAQQLQIDPATLILIPAVFPDPELLSHREPFDIIFMDPPYHQNFIQPCCDFLIKQKLIKPNTLIFIETERDLDPLPIPAEWRIKRSKMAGQVRYYFVAVTD